MANSNLTEAQRAKNDEFYTQYADIEKEISAYRKVLAAGGGFGRKMPKGEPRFRG
jgi:hypothetical protein